MVLLKKAIYFHHHRCGIVLPTDDLANYCLCIVLTWLSILHLRIATPPRMANEVVEAAVRVTAVPVAAAVLTIRVALVDVNCIWNRKMVQLTSAVC